jgi:outer membrane immunogenic protein
MGNRHKLYCTVAAAALLAAFNGAATAADMPVKAAPLAPAVSAPTTWAGFYMGGHLGYGWSKMSGEASDPPSPLVDDMKLHGAVAGVHAGYNWQYSQLVFGVEGDISGVFGTNWSKNVAQVSSAASGAHGE